MSSMGVTEEVGVTGAAASEAEAALRSMVQDLVVPEDFTVVLDFTVVRVLAFVGRPCVSVSVGLPTLITTATLTIPIRMDTRTDTDSAIWRNETIDSTTPMGRAMIQMASVFGEQERQIIRSRVVAGLNRVREQGKKLGRPMIGTKVEDAIRQQLEAGHGILKVAKLVGVGSETMQRIKRVMAAV
jgi:hypothetical protein